MAKPNYSFEKRQRELAKKKKKEEKRMKKSTSDDYSAHDAGIAVVPDGRPAETTDSQ